MHTDLMTTSLHEFTLVYTHTVQMHIDEQTSSHRQFPSLYTSPHMTDMYDLHSASTIKIYYPAASIQYNLEVTHSISL